MLCRAHVMTSRLRLLWHAQLTSIQPLTLRELRDSLNDVQLVIDMLLLGYDAINKDPDNFVLQVRASSAHEYCGWVKKIFVVCISTVGKCSIVNTSTVCHTYIYSVVYAITVGKIYVPSHTRVRFLGDGSAGVM